MQTIPDTTRRHLDSKKSKEQLPTTHTQKKGTTLPRMVQTTTTATQTRTTSNTPQQRILKKNGTKIQSRRPSKI